MENVTVITKEEWKKIRGSSPEPDQVMLSIKGDAAHSMTVRWRTDTTVDTGYALYREIGATEWKKALAEKWSFTTDMDDCHFFFADMTGLSPDTKYEYTCGSDEKNHKSRGSCACGNYVAYKPCRLQQKQKRRDC